jgi:hypothetical protein
MTKIKMTMITANRMRRYADRKNAEAQAVLDKFKTRFDENPLDAFEWADDAMAAAATQYAMSSVIWRLNERSTDEDGGASMVYAAVLELTVQGAQSPRRSTSPVSNIQHVNVTAAYAQFVREFEHAP